MNTSARVATSASRVVPSSRAPPSAISTTASAAAKRRPPIVHSPQKNGGNARNGQQTLHTTSGRKSLAPPPGTNRSGFGTAEFHLLEQQVNIYFCSCNFLHTFLKNLCLVRLLH